MPDDIKTKPFLYISSSPHIASRVNSRILMSNVLLALAPVSIFGVFLYGVPALLTILVSVASAEIAETLFRKITGQDFRFKDLSTAVTGLLLALVLPPGVPLWMTALGAAFAIIAAKEFFGGLGANVFNPALIGRAFLIMSFPAAMTVWPAPNTLFGAVDAVSGATPLALIKDGLAISGDYWSNAGIFFLGFRQGCIGESSVLLILCGFLYLLISGTIDWRAPLSMILSVFAFSFIFGRDPLIAILAGGVVFGAVFMATDYVTTPLTSSGKLIFGFGVGLITVLIRQWGNYPEGVSYGILIMNAATPYLNKLLQKKYGYVKPPKPGREEKAKGGAK